MSLIPPWKILDDQLIIEYNGKFISVKKFPYRGKRRNNPPSIDITKTGGIILNNDLFGRTIWTFEKKIKECFDRRKKNFLDIQRIVVPPLYKDRSSLSTRRIGIHRKFLKILIGTIGTQYEIKLRQRLFMVQNYVNRYGDEDSIPLFTGSLSEGLIIPGSDEDEMLVLKFIRVLNGKLPTDHNFTDVFMDTERTQAGFATLKLIANDTRRNNYIDSALINNTDIVSSSKFREQFIQPGSYSHGPCMSFGDGSYDFAICLFSPQWPETAHSWISRMRRSKWPPKNLISDIVDDGCLLVPIGPRVNDENFSQWRISFSMAEKRLMISMNHTQILCYGLLKIVLKETIESQEYLKGYLCSYYLKTALFWLSENYPPHFWNYDNMLKCFHVCIEKLIEWVRTCICPNYFIPENNMFNGKINPENNMPMLVILNEILKEGYKYLSRCPIFSDLTLQFSRSKLEREVSRDLLALRAIHSYPFDSLSLAYKSLLSVSNLVKLEKCPFIREVCIYFEAVICKQIPQLQKCDKPNESTGNKQIYKDKRRERHLLLRGTRTDFGSGWLMFASYLYNQGEYNNTQFITEYILSGIQQGMIGLRKPSYTETERKTYRETVCGRKMTLPQKIKVMTFSFVLFNDKSSLIAKEFTPEANIRPLLMAPPIVYAYCLQFLCHYHMKNIENQTIALQNIEATIRERKWIRDRALSHSLTLLGVCCQLHGEVNLARKYYTEAKNTTPVCKSVHNRLLNLP